MRCDRVFASQLANSTLHALSVEAQVIVHEVRLDSVARPRPADTLDAIHKELAGSQVHRIGCDIPNLIQFVVRATEGTCVRSIEGGVLVVHRYAIVGSTVFLLDINKAESLAVCHTIPGFAVAKSVQCLAVFLVERFLPTFAIVDIDGVDKVMHYQITEGLTTEVVEHTIFRNSLTSLWLALLALQVEGGGRCVDGVEVPMGCWHVDAGAVSHAILVNPYLILIGGQPRRVCLDGIAINKQSWRGSLVPHLQVQFVLTLWHDKSLRHTKLQLAVEHKVKTAFGGYRDGLRMSQVDHRGEFHSGPMRVLFPERREHGAPFRSPVVETVA